MSEMIFKMTSDGTVPATPSGAWLDEGWTTSQPMVADHGDRAYVSLRDAPNAPFSAPVLVAEWGVTFPITPDEQVLRG